MRLPKRLLSRLSMNQLHELIRVKKQLDQVTGLKKVRDVIDRVIVHHPCAGIVHHPFSPHTAPAVVG